MSRFLTSSERFRQREEHARAMADLHDLYMKVHQKLMDGRPAEAIEFCAPIVAGADALGESFTTTQYPICEACQGFAEMMNPSEHDRKVRCQDVPEVCQGNRYGRMHPVQLADYVTACVAGLVKPREEDPSPDQPEVPLVDPDLEPAPPSSLPYVYHRDAVITFNANREIPIPVPEPDEEMVAHPDGTFTIRKIGGS